MQVARDPLARRSREPKGGHTCGRRTQEEASQRNNVVDSLKSNLLRLCNC